MFDDRLEEDVAVVSAWDKDTRLAIKYNSFNEYLVVHQYKIDNQIIDTVPDVYKTSDEAMTRFNFLLGNRDNKRVINRLDVLEPK